MNFGYTPESFGWLILLVFGTVIAFAVLLLLTRLTLRLMGIKKDGLVVAAFFGFALVALLGLSLALDSFGEQVTAQITSKRETVTVNRRGDWRHTYLLGLRLDAKGLTLPVPSNVDSTLLESFLKDTGTQFSTYSPDVVTYDRVHEGDPFSLRVLRVGGLSLTRPANQNTFTFLPLAWLLAILAGIVLMVLLWRKLWWLFLLIIVLLVVTVPMVNAYRDQQAADHLANKTERATATVQDVRRVTEWDFIRRGGRNRGEYALRQPYEIVELQFTPRGARSAVIGVDAVDVAANAAPMFTKGQTVEIQYAHDQPRNVRLDGHTRNWHWRDMVGVYIDSALILGTIVLFLLLLAWFGWRRKKSKPLTPEAQ
ncbi:MAG: hypothetical protein JST84_27515 [Acidobacteria bacterium]|nr:hypothetical protein [Acidobacteriota bacterium]